MLGTPVFVFNNSADLWLSLFDLTTLRAVNPDG